MRLPPVCSSVRRLVAVQVLCCVSGGSGHGTLTLRGLSLFLGVCAEEWGCWPEVSVLRSCQRFPGWLTQVPSLGTR